MIGKSRKEKFLFVKLTMKSYDFHLKKKKTLITTCKKKSATLINVAEKSCVYVNVMKIMM
jgi:hypothetical protein